MGDRRNQEDRRAINDRRRNDRRRGADHRRPMFEICRSMLYLALVHESPGDAPQRVVTRAIRWRKESESLHTEQGLQELT